MNPSKTTVEVVDTKTIRVLEPVELNIDELKTKLIHQQDDFDSAKRMYDGNLAKLQAKVDETTQLILQAKNLGVQ